MGLYPSRPRRRRSRTRPRRGGGGACLSPGASRLRAPRLLAGRGGRRLRVRLPRLQGRRGPCRGDQWLLASRVPRPLQGLGLRGPWPPLDRPQSIPGHVRRRSGPPQSAGARHCPLLRAGSRPPRRDPTLPRARDPRPRSDAGLPEVPPYLVGELALCGDLEVDAQRGAP